MEREQIIMNEYTECTTCGRKLKDKKSIDRGYGPVCYEKHLKAVAEKEQLLIDQVLENAREIDGEGDY